MSTDATPAASSSDPAAARAGIRGSPAAAPKLPTQ
eukprot:gene8506-5572_t